MLLLALLLSYWNEIITIDRTAWDSYSLWTYVLDVVTGVVDVVVVFSVVDVLMKHEIDTVGEYFAKVHAQLGELTSSCCYLQEPATS